MTEKKEQIINQFTLAGMSSLSELLLCEVDTLLQPYPHAQMPVSSDFADGEFSNV